MIHARRARADHPAYQEGVGLYLSDDSRALSRHLKSAELNRVEKSLLQARVALKSNRFSRAQELLADARVTNASPFLASERWMLSATLRSRKGELAAAIRANREAFAGYQAIGDRRGCFLSSYNLSADYGRLGRLEESARFLSFALEHASAHAEKALILRGLAANESKRGRYDEAIAHLVELRRIAGDELPKFELRALDLIEADIAVRRGDFALAERNLSRFKPTSRDPELARILFEKQALRFILRAARDERWPERVPAKVRGSAEQGLRWAVLASLQAGDGEAAARSWSELRRISPSVYGEGYAAVQASDARNAFSRCIEKLRTKSVAPSAIEGLPGKLIVLLSQPGFPNRKESLIERLWGKSYAPELDSRFYKLVERVRKTTPYGIRVRNRTYELVSPV